LLHVTSTVPDKTQTVYIVPEFLVEATFESDDYSFNGVIDYLLVRLAPERSRKLSHYFLSTSDICFSIFASISP
jgi:hypothetical protein